MCIEKICKDFYLQYLQYYNLQYKIYYNIYSSISGWRECQ